MIDCTPGSLLQFLRKEKYDADIEKESQQIYTIFKINDREYPFFLRVFDEGHLLQLLAFIPSHLEPNQDFAFSISTNAPPAASNEKQKTMIGELARLLHLLNKELDVPGFGMDEMAGVVFYRIMLPTPRKKIDPELLLAYLKTVEHVCSMFSIPIQAISSGEMTLQQIIAKAKEMDKK